MWQLWFPSVATSPQEPLASRTLRTPTLVGNLEKVTPEVIITTRDTH